jgi:CheY-like chemotaxis protein
LPRLFQPFVQLDSSLSRQHGGTGLGLSLVKRMAEMHSGQILVESHLGEGSRFTILLPWVQDEVQPLPVTRRMTDRLKSAIIVQMDQPRATRLAALLQSIGIKDHLISSAFDALELATQIWPDIVFIDDQNASGTGTALLAEFKADARTHDIPIIVVTQAENSALTRQSGADGILVEPFSKNELYAELKRLAFSALP